MEDRNLRKGKGAMPAEVSNALVHLHTEHFGKGPIRAKAYALDDMLVCVLHEGLTTLERTLIASGREETVHEIRRSFDKLMFGAAPGG